MRLKELEEENRRLNRRLELIVADQALRITVLKEVNSKKMVSKAGVGHVVKKQICTERQACRYLKVSRSIVFVANKN